MNNNYRNPEWVRKIMDLVEGKEETGHVKENPKIKVDKIKITITPKEDGLLWTEMLKDLNFLKRRENELILFPDIYEKLCRKFSMNKAKIKNCLLFLAEFGFITFVRFRGIKLNYEISLVD